MKTVLLQNKQKGVDGTECLLKVIPITFWPCSLDARSGDMTTRSSCWRLEGETRWSFE